MSYANLDVVSYGRLSSGHEEEIARLIDVCVRSGIFLLDLGDANEKLLLEQLASVDEAQKLFFARPRELKEEFRSLDSGFGYEQVLDPPVEMFEISRQEQMRNTLKLPGDLAAVTAELEGLAAGSDMILQTLLGLLCRDEDKTAAMPSKPTGHRDPGKSNLGLGIATAPVGTSLMASHVDDGLLTILYHVTPFLEVPDADSKEWRHVQSSQRLHVVNVGSALQQLSRGKFKAAEHRVVQVPGENRLVTYYMYPSSAEQ